MKRHLEFALLFTSVALLLLAPNAMIPAHAQGSDPAAVLNAFQAALDAHDATRASGLFAADAVVAVTDSTSTFSGQASITTWLQYVVSQHAALTPKSAQAAADVVLAVTSLKLDLWTSIGVGPLDEILQMVVQNGKIKSLVMSLTPASRMQLDAALAKYQGTDAQSITLNLIMLINAQKTDAAAALFADDAVVTTVPPAPKQSGVYSGKQAIQGWLKSLPAQNFHIDHGFMLFTGMDSVLSSDRISMDGFTQLGLASLDEIAQVVVQNGKIKSFTASFTSDSLAKLMASAPK